MTMSSLMSIDDVVVVCPGSLSQPGIIEDADNAEAILVHWDGQHRRRDPAAGAEWHSASKQMRTISLITQPQP